MILFTIGFIPANVNASDFEMFFDNFESLAFISQILLVGNFNVFLYCNNNDSNDPKCDMYVIFKSF